VELTVSGLNVTAIPRTQNKTRRWDTCKKKESFVSYNFESRQVLYFHKQTKLPKEWTPHADVHLYSLQTSVEPNNLGTNEHIELFFVFVLWTKHIKWRLYT
jgi:hypothetical protein